MLVSGLVIRVSIVLRGLQETGGSTKEGKIGAVQERTER